MEERDEARRALEAEPIGVAVGRVLARIEAHLGGASEQGACVFAGHFTKATAGLVEIGFFALNPDESLAHLEGSNTSRTAAHVGVKDGVAFAEMINAPAHDLDWLLGRMNLCAIIAVCQRIAVQDSSVTVNAAPCLFTFSEVAITEACSLVPDQKATARGENKVITAPNYCRNLKGQQWGKVRDLVVPLQVVSDFEATILPNTSTCPNPIRRISHNSIDLAERRQNVPAIPEIQRCPPDCLNAHHLPPAMNLPTSTPSGTCSTSHVMIAATISMSQPPLLTAWSQQARRCASHGQSNVISLVMLPSFVLVR